MEFKIDLNHIKNIYFVGIKGVAMTALAIVAKERGIAVSGSDVAEEFPTDAMLKKNNIKFFIDFKKEYVTNVNPDLVIYTGAHGGSQNKEVIVAKKLGISTLPHGRALGIFMKGKKGISVAGSHGKTTTSAMLATVLTKNGYDPSFTVGCGEIFALGTSGHHGKGEYFVAEADEYVTDPIADLTPRFLWHNPKVAVITNIEYDHPDVFKNIDDVKVAFQKFIKTVGKDGFVAACTDDKNTKAVIAASQVPVTTYGTGEGVDFRLTDVSFACGETHFTVTSKGKKLETFTINVPGKHNALNATACIATLVNLGVPLQKIKKGLAAFTGSKRRFEFCRQKAGTLFYDDYAHHPTEIATTLKSARKWFPKRRIIVVFQPHTYSRTKALMQEFSICFSDADIVLIPKIYASAREHHISGVSGKHLFQNIAKHHKNVVYTPTKADVIQYLERTIKPNDIVITMGAGDVYQWIKYFVKSLKS